MSLEDVENRFFTGPDSALFSKADEARVSGDRAPSWDIPAQLGQDHSCSRGPHTLGVLVPYLQNISKKDHSDYRGSLKSSCTEASFNVTMVGPSSRCPQPQCEGDTLIASGASQWTLGSQTFNTCVSVQQSLVASSGSFLHCSKV